MTKSNDLINPWALIALATAPSAACADPELFLLLQEWREAERRLTRAYEIQIEAEREMTPLRPAALSARIPDDARFWPDRMPMSGVYTRTWVDENRPYIEVLGGRKGTPARWVNSAKARFNEIQLAADEYDRALENTGVTASIAEAEARSLDAVDKVVEIRRRVAEYRPKTIVGLLGKLGAYVGIVGHDFEEESDFDFHSGQPPRYRDDVFLSVVGDYWRLAAPAEADRRAAAEATPIATPPAAREATAEPPLPSDAADAGQAASGAA